MLESRDQPLEPLRALATDVPQDEEVGRRGCGSSAGFRVGFGERWLVWGLIDLGGELIGLDSLGLKLLERSFY
jgi:hypothetical protein